MDGVVHVLDSAKAKRLGGRTMLTPSPTQVRTVVMRIPAGQTRNLKELQRELAWDAGADVACPVATRKAWYAVAEAAEADRQAGAIIIAPWWRVLRSGKFDNKVPGGEARHQELLAAETNHG